MRCLAFSSALATTMIIESIEVDDYQCITVSTVCMWLQDAGLTRMRGLVNGPIQFGLEIP